jgi:hypothetical protein
MLPGLKSILEIASVAALIGSGLIHAGIFACLGRSWEDPLSFRKATLFGVSTGLTLWSCLWVVSCLAPSAYHQRLRKTLCVTLVLEVFLITLQTWRGQESHFNHDGPFNGLIELTMLVLISLAVLAMFLITIGSWFPRSLHGVSTAMAWAIRWGMLLLCLSALVGYAITWIGQQQLSQGLSATRWKGHGVLKFPHGAALHAIQTLALAAWIADRWKLSNPVALIHGLAGAHACWLIYALYQTFAGLDRFEWDTTSCLLLGACAVCTLMALALGARLWRKGPLD